MRVKAICVLTAIILLSLLSSAQTYAHGGGTNAQGCHKNSATGVEHCHDDELPNKNKSKMWGPNALKQETDKSCYVELPRCNGCGCKGGPGYRSIETGKCVGYKALYKVCGTPNRSRCVFENAPNTGLNRRCVLGLEDKQLTDDS